MKFKKWVVILLAMAFVGVTCMGALAQINLSWSSISVPEDAHTKAMTVFKDEVERLSDGKITVDLYVAGEIYTQEGELAACREGTLDMAYFSDNWLAEFVPYLSMIGAVYMDRVLNGEIGKEIYEDVAQKTGVRPLAAFYLGTRQLNLVEKAGPVRTPQDMKGVKLRTPASPAWIALGKALGGNPTPMSFGEVYMGLKTGAIEGQDNPLPTDKNAKFYEVTKYIVLTDHVVNTVWPTINEQRWQSLSELDKLVIHKAIDKARVFCAETNLKADVIEDPDKEAFAEYAQWSYQNESKDISMNWDMELYQRIQEAKPE